MLRIKEGSGNRIVLTWTEEEALFADYREFNLATAYNLAFLSHFSYLNKEDIQEILVNENEIKVQEWAKIAKEKMGWDFYEPLHHPSPLKSSELKYFEDTKIDTQFIVVKQANKLFIAVRGSEHPSELKKLQKDWLGTNADAQDVDFIVQEGHCRGQCHQGFYNAYHFVALTLLKQFSEDVLSDSEIYLTGHSMGGAIATLVAAWLRESWNEKIACYTFGAPRAGDTVFDQHFTQVKPFPLFRFVHRNDLVPMVPPPGMETRFNLLEAAFEGEARYFLVRCLTDDDANPFRHMGRLFHLDHAATGQVLLMDLGHNTDAIEVKRPPIHGPARYTPQLMSRFFADFIGDHSMDKYLQTLWQEMVATMAEAQGELDRRALFQQKIGYWEKARRSLEAGHFTAKPGDRSEEEDILNPKPRAEPDRTSTRGTQNDQVDKARKRMLQSVAALKGLLEKQADTRNPMTRLFGSLTERGARITGKYYERAKKTSQAREAWEGKTTS